MSICSSTPQDHMVYKISNQSSIGFDYFFFFLVGRIRLCWLPNLIEPYRSIKFSIWFSSINKTFDLVRVATSGVIINSCEGFSSNDG